MRTRMIHTKVWKDEYFGELNRVEKLLFIYLLTNDKANICGIYELSDREIKFDLDITEPELQEAKAHFQRDGKFVFHNSWVRVINYEKYNPYTGSKNESAKESELKLCPIQLLEYPIDRVSTILDSPTNTNTISKSISNTKEYLLSLEAKKDLYEKFPRLKERAIDKELEKMIDWLDANGKKKKDYKAFARNWIRTGEEKIDKKVFYKPDPPVNESGLDRLAEIKQGIGRSI